MDHYKPLTYVILRCRVYLVIFNNTKSSVPMQYRVSIIVFIIYLTVTVLLFLPRSININIGVNEGGQSLPKEKFNRKMFAWYLNLFFLKRKIHFYYSAFLFMTMVNIFMKIAYFIVKKIFLLSFCPVHNYKALTDRKRFTTSIKLLEFRSAMIEWRMSFIPLLFYAKNR